MIYDNAADSSTDTEEEGSVRGSSLPRGFLGPLISKQLYHSTPKLNIDEPPEDAADQRRDTRSVSPRPSYLQVKSDDATGLEFERSDSVTSISSAGQLYRRPSGSTLDAEFRLVGSSRVRRVSDDIAFRRRSFDELSTASGDPDPDIDKAALTMENRLLYLMVARCISYPFNAKHQLETSPPKVKLNLNRFNLICRTLQSCLDEEEDVIRKIFLTQQERACTRNKKFLQCVLWFMDTVIQRDDVNTMCRKGMYSVKELDAIFKVASRKHLGIKHSSPQFEEHLDHQLWCSTFRKLVEQSSHSSSVSSPGTPMGANGGGGAPNPDQLFKMFQLVLKIRNIEHQILYRICQLGDQDEQQSVVRKELQKRKSKLDEDKIWERARNPTFGSRRIEEIYRDEQQQNVKTLTGNLDRHLSGALGYHSPRLQRKSGTATITKHDLQLSLKVLITVHELSQIGMATEGKPIFCVFEMVDGDKSFQTQPIIPYDRTVTFDEAGEFWTHSPLPQFRFTVRMEAKSFFSDDKILAKKVHTAMPTSSEVHETIELLRNERDVVSVAKLKVSIFVDRPSDMKKCGFLSCNGDILFRQWKRRFFTLVQLSHDKFVLCHYSARDTQPRDHLMLEGFTVEYFTPEEEDEIPKKDSDYMFALMSETSQLRFACRDDTDRESWMQWMVRATGQNEQPQLDQTDSMAKTSDLDRYGLSDVVKIDITDVDPHKMFIKLFKATLDFRLSEDVFSRGLFSPTQMYVIDEFCARYSVRDSFRHLTCLKEWVERENNGEPIWPVMMLSSFRFCQMHVGGMNPPEKSVIVTREEQDALKQLSQQIEELVTTKIENFRTTFPFGCPKDDLKVTIKLFTLVAAVNHSTPTLMNEGSSLRVLTIAMERAALINYKQIFSKLNVENENAPLSTSLLFELAQKCIEMMYELHDFYQEDFAQVATVFSDHIDAFWSFFLVDAREAMALDNDIIRKLQLFHTVNQYFCSQPTLRLGQFHRSFLDEFSPIVMTYVEGFEVVMKDDSVNSFGVELWKPPLPDSKCCAAVEGTLKALASLKNFLRQLDWPEETFAAHLEQRVRSICIERFQDAADLTMQQMNALFTSVSVTVKFSLLQEMFSMINTLVHLNEQVMQVCSPQRAPNVEDQDEVFRPEEDIEDYLSQTLQSAITLIIDKLCLPLSSLLGKLAVYDPHDSFIATLKLMLPKKIPVAAYGQFVVANLQEISNHLVPTIFNNFLLNWYECQLQLMNQWLDNRPTFSLHSEQQLIITALVTSIHENFENCDVPSEQLESDAYLAVQDRLRKEKSSDLLSGLGKD